MLKLHADFSFQGDPALLVSWDQVVKKETLRKDQMGSWH